MRASRYFFEFQVLGRQTAMWPQSIVVETRKTERQQRIARDYLPPLPAVVEHRKTDSSIGIDMHVKEKPSK